MIGFLLRGMMPTGTGILAGVVACMAMYGMYKCMQCRLRHCPCCRWCLRVTGSDAFADFQLMVFVHEATFTSCDTHMSTNVRVTAGDQQVATEASSNKQYHQPLIVLIEQGSENLVIELMNAKRGRLVAKLELDVIKDILKGKMVGQKRTFAMKEVSKDVVGARLTVTFKEYKGDDEEEGQGLVVKELLVDDGMDTETKIMMQAHLANIQHELVEKDGSDGTAELPPHIQKMRLIAKGCCGPVEVVGSWGAKSKQYLAVEGPPEKKKFRLAVWGNELDFHKGNEPDKEIQLLRVRGVAPHPQSDKAFVVSHFLTPERKEDLLIYSTDRHVQVWVESLSLLVKMVHEIRSDNKKAESKRDSGNKGSKSAGNKKQSR